MLHLKAAFGIAASLILSTSIPLLHALPFKYFSYLELAKHLTHNHDSFPRFARLTTSQDKFNLPTVGTCGDDSPCLNYLLTLDDYTNPNPYSPDVFISGELHGDETGESVRGAT